MAGEPIMLTADELLKENKSPLLIPYELARKMLNAIGWDGDNYRLRDLVALAIAPEVERLNKEKDMIAKDVTTFFRIVKNPRIGGVYWIDEDKLVEVISRDENTVKVKLLNGENTCLSINWTELCEKVVEEAIGK